MIVNLRITEFAIMKRGIVGIRQPKDRPSQGSEIPSIWFPSLASLAAALPNDNLTLKKIPKMVLARCEWGHDDYSRNVANLPLAEPFPPAPAAKTIKSVRKSSDSRTKDMFGDGEEA